MYCTQPVAILIVTALAACAASSADDAASRSVDGPFERIATFAVHRNTSIDSHSVAEILSATADGQIVVYTDSEGGRLGVLDISDPANPGIVNRYFSPGFAHGVAVSGDLAFVADDF